MRILVATPFVPHPSADHGGGVYLAALLRAVADGARVSLVTMCRPGEEVLLREMPWFERTAAVPIARSADRRGLARAGEKAALAWRWGVRRMPLFAAKMWSPAFADALQAAVIAAPPQVALFEFAVLAQYLRGFGRPCPTVLTDHERGGHAPAGVLGREFGRHRDARLWRRYVLRHYPRADLIQVVNPEDAHALSAVLHREVGVRPVLVDLPATTSTPALAPPRALFVGDYAHHPNAEAAVFAVEQVWPEVRRRVPEAELWLVGPRAPHHVRALERHAGVRYLGFVADLSGVLGQARCLLAPVFSGQGSRVKVLTALAHGLPVVANARALSGISAPPPAVACAEGRLELAGLTARWLREPATAGVAGQAARAWAEVGLSPGRVAAEQLERFSALAGAWTAS